MALLSDSINCSAACDSASTSASARMSGPLPSLSDASTSVKFFTFCSKTPLSSANQRSNVLSGSLFQPLTWLSKKFSVFQKQNRYSPGPPPDSTGGDLTRLVHAKNSARLSSTSRRKTKRKRRRGRG